MALPDHLRALLAESEIDVYRSSGPGGQKKNKTESSVRVRHLPTGIIRIATEHRSQTRNRELALERLLAALEVRNRKPKPRVATKPTRSAKVKRLESKRREGAIKSLRRERPARED